MSYDGPVVDTHVHLRLDEAMFDLGTPYALEDYLKAADGADVRAAAVLVMAPPADLDPTRVLNDLAMAVRSDEIDWFAMCSVHPYDGDLALAELERVAEAGAGGVKLHPNTQAFDVADERVTAVVARAAEPATSRSTRRRQPRTPYDGCSATRTNSGGSCTTTRPSCSGWRSDDA